MNAQGWETLDAAARLDWVSAKLTALEQQMHRLMQRLSPQLDGVAGGWLPSATNLVHYVAMRSEDLRELQARLSELGLSSLGRSEPGALANLRAVMELVVRASGRPEMKPPLPGASPTRSAGRALLAAHTDELFGPARPDEPVRIMVTMPTEAAERPELIRTLMGSGMGVMRINCAHDDAAAWRSMARHLRAANAALNQRCLVQLDLPGPKLRTGPFEPGPRVLHLKPKRDALGNMVQVARVRLQAEGAPEAAPNALTMPRPFVELLSRGHRIEFRDHQGRARQLEVVARDDAGAWATSNRGAFITPDTELSVEVTHGQRAAARPRAVPEVVGRVHIALGDRIVLCGPGERGHPGSVGEPATVSCTIAEAVAALRPGHHVWFDDGKIGGVVERTDGLRAVVHITHGRPTGLDLGADKGINLPDTHLAIATLSAEDLAVLDVACEVGDLVALSFCRSSADVLALHEALEARHAKLGVVLKVETREGFENLSSLLLTAMRRPPFGVMIARGDLAVECGFARLAELQEEMLCLCEAAHAPVIWATQVLETAAQKGFPSRAEVTDAAVGERAECVMLNKGPYVEQAVQTLADILHRMQSHQHKKTPLFRRLRSLRIARRAPGSQQNNGRGQL